MSTKQIIKRDGRVVPFEPQKITAAILKAAVAAGREDGEIAKKLSDQVVSAIETQFKGKTPHVEEVQDLVEKTLIDNKSADIAKAYILYRREREEIRRSRRFVGVAGDLKISVNAAKVLAQRYLIKDDQGSVVETPSQMFRRVAKAIASADAHYADPKEVESIVSQTEEEFYQAMVGLQFLPNSPTLMNAGTSLGQLAACFVLPVPDSITGIFDAVRATALVHQSGGGTGFSFSSLRPKGDIVRSTKGIASGPVSFMRVFDVATDVLKQGGRRRGANMGILRFDHPDIVEFVTAKQKAGFLENFNVSVAVTSAFMVAVDKNEDFDLVNPRTTEPVGKMSARYLWDLIIAMAWSTGDPGLFFIDRANELNPTPKIGQFESTNPCGEVPLLPFESCVLGSINLGRIVRNRNIDWASLGRLVRMGVHFLDNVIDQSKYPLVEIHQITTSNRKIGLGLMGFADMLVQLGIPYDSEQTVELSKMLMKFVEDEAVKMSKELAGIRGSFPDFGGSRWEDMGYERLRNATVTTIAPTGTISIIANCSSGIEPIFAVSYAREVMEGTTLLETNPYFEEIARARGFYSRDLMLDIARTGTVAGRSDVPDDVRRVFRTAFDIDPEWHVKIQAAFQKYTDNAVSKTVNLPENATLDDVKKIYRLAFDLGCKGITAYRYGSKKEQVLYIRPPEKQKIVEAPITAGSEYSGGCAWGYCPA